MNIDEFKSCFTEVIDYLADYKDSVGEREVIPNEEPGFMRKYIAKDPPENGEKWEELMQDLENYVMPGLVHWIHPQFHSYFPLGASNASLLGCALSLGINCSANTWLKCPASVELEMATLDWVASLYGLPDKFHFYKPGSKGGSILQGSASECTLMCLYAAQRTALEKQKQKFPGKSDSELLSMQRGYISTEAHSSIEKDCLIALVDVRILETDEELRFRGETLEKAVKEDLEKGLFPFYCAATFGTTSCSTIDKIDELGPICQKYDLWFHVDGAYGLAGLSCPEFRHYLQGFEHVRSINTNPCKWLLSHYDCNIMWVDDRLNYARCVSGAEVKEYPNTPITDYHLWTVCDLRRFRIFKIYFMCRNYGVEGIQKYIRNHVALADKFAELVRSDDRFEVVTKNFGLVCFRLKGSNKKSTELLAAITASKKLFMVPTSLRDVYVIRFCVDYEHAREEHITYAWKVITGFTDQLNLAKSKEAITGEKKAEIPTM